MPSSDQARPPQRHSPWELEPDPEHAPPPVKADTAFLDTADDFDDPVRTLARKQERSMWLLAVLATIVLIATLGVWVLTRDSGPVWDEDLLMDHVPPAVGLEVPRASERLRLALESARPLSPDASNAKLSVALWSTPTLAKAAQANAALLDQIRDLITETSWVPGHYAWVEQNLCDHPGWPALENACIIATIYEARQQHSDVAISLTLDLMTLGQRFQAITALPNYYARALDLHRAGCIALASALRNTKLAPQELTRAQSDLDHCAPLDATLEKVLGDYYRFEKGLIVGPLSDDPSDQLAGSMMLDKPGRLFFKTNSTLGLLAGSFRELKTEVMQPPYARSTLQLVARVGPPGRTGAIPGHPNYSGILHANTRLWPYVDLIERQTLARARHQLVRTFFALRRYVAAHATLPATLQNLVDEKILPSLPIDPFTGMPLLYDPTNSLLYSVGSDLHDARGQATGTQMEDDTEPTLSLQ